MNFAAMMQRGIALDSSLPYFLSYLCISIGKPFEEEHITLFPKAIHSTIHPNVTQVSRNIHLQLKQEVLQRADSKTITTKDSKVLKMYKILEFSNPKLLKS